MTPESRTDAAAGSARVLVVIPSRYGSSRFPGKALADLGGKPLVVRVVENAARMERATEIVVATDDDRIYSAVEAAGFACEMTGRHETGTDRIGEVAARRDADIVLNLQGDEPLLDPEEADRVIAALAEHSDADIATCAHRFGSETDWRDPNVVKVITGRDGAALYFSRAPIPGTFPGRESDHRDPWESPAVLRHVGIYAFRRQALLDFVKMERTDLEVTEGLEQLRALENGLRIHVVNISRAPVGVDTPEDLDRVREIWNEETSP